MPQKRTLHSFFAASPPSKKPRPTILEQEPDQTSPAPTTDDHPPAQPASIHATYPFPIADYPPPLLSDLNFVPATEARSINNQPDLDLLYYEPYIPAPAHRQLFLFLRRSLPFYRVRYTIKRGPLETQIQTPRYTTVFGLDATSTFSADGSRILDAATNTPVPSNKYKCAPRPLPACLETLRRLTEATTDERFNFCLVNYYASGTDSISYHSDDERFLGQDPAIASLSLGAKRDFLMKHKPVAAGAETSEVETKPLKLPLASGDMVLMRGRTQANWLHSIPKRKGGESERGRINITFRRALVKGGTENYYQYNVGVGEVYRWSEEAQEMIPWKSEVTTSINGKS